MIPDDEEDGVPFGRIMAAYQKAAPPVRASPAQPAVEGNAMPPGNKAPTMFHGRNVYGERFDNLMRERMVRDAVQPGTIYAAIVAQRHYAVRGYVVDNGNPESMLAYRLRRDGKVQCGLVPRGAVLHMEPFA